MYILAAAADSQGDLCRSCANRFRGLMGHYSFGKALTALKEWRQDNGPASGLEQRCGNGASKGLVPLINLSRGCANAAGQGFPAATGRRPPSRLSFVSNNGFGKPCSGP